MRKFAKYLFLIFCFIYMHFAHSQNENNKWNFGNYVGLDFMTNPPTPVSSNINTSEGCASVADAAGNLLFYTDGSTIWDQTGLIMSNGTGLGGNSSTTQSSIIVKQPGNANIYYVFSLGDGGSANLRYSTLDMSLAGGLGAVTVNAVLISSPMMEKLTSVKHCNGTDFWVLACPSATGVINAYQVTAAGVNTVPVVSFMPNLTTSWLGNMKTSPNGKKIAFANSFSARFDFCDFDNSTGIASNAVNLGSAFVNPYGVEFSPDGTKLYGTTEGNPFFLRQWNLCAGSASAIAASVYSVNAMGQIMGMQLGTDGKIYIAKYGQTDLAVINDPNNLGAACNYSYNSVFSFPTGNSRYNLPNFITSGFSAPPGFTYSVSNVYGCNTASFTASALQQYQQNICSASAYTGVMWNFGDPLSGAANTSTLSSPLHSFTNMGTYTVNLILYNSSPCGGLTDTVTQVVNVNLFCVSVLSQSITCSSLGSATATALNGIGPFTYTWLPSGQTSSVATGLNPGTHTLYAYDLGTGITHTATTNFLSLVPYIGNLSNSPSQPCGAVNTGTASIILSGGSGNQFYTWTGPLGIQTSSMATGLTAGNYTVSVIDALTSCSVTQTFTLAPPPAPLGVVAASSSSSVCAGSQLSLTAAGYGGTPFIPLGYTYNWVFGPQTSSYNFVPMASGVVVHTVTIIDAVNCTASATISITVNPNPTLVVPIVSVCPQQTATLTASGASTYSWNTGATTNSISNLPLATTGYTVTGSALGCTAVATSSIVLNTVPVPTVSSNSPVCSTKTLNLYASGGNTYSWIGPNFFSSPFQNPQLNLAAVANGGIYNVTVTAANSCTASASINVTVHPTPTLATTGATVCTTQTINLLANAQGAVSYTWSGPSNFNVNTANPVIANPSPSISGIYSLNVTSIDGCTNTAQVNVTVSALPLPVFTSNSPKCEGSTLIFNSSASSGASVYSWSGPNGFTSGFANPIIPNLSPNANGTYTLTLIEGPCSSTISQNVIVFTNPIPAINHNAPLCETKTFSASISTAYPLYQWSGPNGFTSANQSFSIANTNTTQSGVYTAIVTDSNTCQGQTSASITIMPNPVLNVTGADVCYGRPAQISVSGANSYSWSGPGGFSSFAAQAIIASATNTSTFTYYVIGQSANTCTSLATALVTTKALPTAEAMLTERGCLNSPIYFESSGGLIYNWSGPLGFNQSQQNFSVNINNVGMAGNYTLTVTDAQGCQGYKTVSLTVDPAPQGSLWRNNDQNCIPFCTDFKFIPVGAAIVSSNWLVNGQKVETETFNYCFTNAGDYILKGEFTDSQSCKSTVEFLVKANPRPKADYSYFPQEVVEGADIQFESTSGGIDLKNYSWYFASNQAQAINQQRLNYIFPDAGVYPVAMVVKNKWGCEDTVVKAITVSEDFYLYVPNAFTPNGDQLNETFKAVTRGVKTFNIMIHNRWGELIYQSNELSPGWDGSFKGQPCKEDVYAWQIEATSLKGKEQKLSGSVLLYR